VVTVGSGACGSGNNAWRHCDVLKLHSSHFPPLFSAVNDKQFLGEVEAADALLTR
jgi:hypothetical protein